MTAPGDRTVLLGAVVAIAGGVTVFFSPGSLMSTLQGMAVALWAVAALHAVGTLAPSAWWTSPFDGAANAADPTDDDEPHVTDWIRSRMAGRRVPIADDVALPPETLRLLRPLIASALVQAEIDPNDPEAVRRARLSPLTRAVLGSDPTIQPGWWRTLRPDERSTAEAVHRVLDDLRRFSRRAPPSHHAPTLEPPDRASGS